MHSVLNHLRRAALLPGGGRVTDARLLEAFLARRDEGAFEALMHRHGPVVLGVCRRILVNAHDAEDAFQATFLVLARKAGSLRSREVLAGWLHRVAWRTAIRARLMARKRRFREEQAAKPLRHEMADEVDRELLARLDAELNRLPEKYRVPVVLCELEGRSRREAARTLGVPEGTLSWRLAHARKLLARALSRAGAPLPAVAVATMLAEQAASAPLPVGLLTTTARAASKPLSAAGMVSASVLHLTDGVMKAMLISKLKATWAVALVALLGLSGAGVTYRAVARNTPTTRTRWPRSRRR